VGAQRGVPGRESLSARTHRAPPERSHRSFSLIQSTLLSAASFAAILALASPAVAAGPGKAEVCHWTAAGFYNLLNVSVTSAHFDPAIHPNDVGPGPLFSDADGDGFGDPDTEVFGCPEPGLVSNGDDCDDADASLGEVCGIDFDGLFGLLETDIVILNTTTGAAGVHLAAPLSPSSYHLTWNPWTEEFISLEDGFDGPRLVTIDPCTGSITSDVPLSHPSSTVFFCEGLDYDQVNDRLVGSCNLDGPIAALDLISESVVEIDLATGAVTVLATSPTTLLDREFDLLVFVGDDARAHDGRGTRASNGWFTVDSTTWATSVSRANFTPFGAVAWEWDDELLYSVTHTISSSPYRLQIQDVDQRTVVTDIGPTGLSSLYGSPDPRGLTFAAFTCP
jgi:hypothetical protein